MDEHRPVGSAIEAPVKRPRWVVVGMALAVALVALLIVAMISGGHGPGRHSGSPYIGEVTETAAV